MIRFKPEVKEIIIICKSLADKFNNHYVSSNHFLLAVNEHKINKVAPLLVKSGLPNEHYELLQKQLLEPDQFPLENVPLTKEFELGIKSSRKQAWACGSRNVYIEHIFLSLLADESSLLSQNLAQTGINFNSFIKMLKSEGIEYRHWRKIFSWLS